MNYHIITLGCPKNSVDSEGMGGILRARGHRASDATEADVIIVNTCSFIAAARDETLGVLREVAAAKRAGQRLIAAGCMAESHPDIVRAVPGVDAIIGTREWTRIDELVGGTAVVAAPALVIDLTAAPVAPPEPPGDPASLVVPGAYADWRTTPIQRQARGPSAYVKISDGCNLRCAFCTIPSFKGDMRSKALGAIVAEARELVAQGVREIVLVAQHLTDYGRDLRVDDGLARLLDALCAALPADVWLRLMYAYPHGITPRLIETMARHPQVCHYLDMPLQHAHPAVLRRMRRPPDSERTLATIHALRHAMPDIAIRSTFIVGFPGETREEFDALLAFLREAELDRVGVFRYSPEPGTAAAALPDPVAPRIVERRWHEVMQVQQTISRQRTRRMLGRTLRVLIEGSGTADDGRPIALGRSYRDAPEVDGQVFVWGVAPVGAWCDVRVVRTSDYDVWTEPLAGVGDGVAVTPPTGS